ncbi:hypothetical protein DQG23_31270, partial [Paenibacillus contaminans]
TIQRVLVLFKAEILAPTGMLIVRQTKLIIAFASLVSENEHFTCEIVRTASLTIRFSPLSTGHA